MESDRTFWDSAFFPLDLSRNCELSHPFHTFYLLLVQLLLPHANTHSVATAIHAVFFCLCSQLVHECGTSRCGVNGKAWVLHVLAGTTFVVVTCLVLALRYVFRTLRSDPSGLSCSSASAIVHTLFMLLLSLSLPFLLAHCTSVSSTYTVILTSDRTSETALIAACIASRNNTTLNLLPCNIARCSVAFGDSISLRREIPAQNSKQWNWEFEVTLPSSILLSAVFSEHLLQVNEHCYVFTARPQKNKRTSEKCSPAKKTSVAQLLNYCDHFLLLRFCWNTDARSSVLPNHLPSQTL